ncbi:MAG: hypothetical protein KF732_05165 [Flavobacteriales bacterium]|nr:hypothetical protein [Flavobacteriales bacterium]
MKNIFIISFLLIISNNAYNQNIDSLFIDAHAVNLGYGEEYQIERYFIHDKIEKFNHGEKGISQIKRKYSLSKKLVSSFNPEIKIEHKLLIDKKDVGKNITLTTICYIIPYKYDLTQVLFLQTYFDRNINIENQFVNYFIGDSIPEYIKNSAAIDTIDFIGRKIILGNICDWRGPHNISCANKGQMSWSIFQNEKMAEQDIIIRRHLASNSNLSSIQSEEKVSILFEGIPTTAIKTTMKISVPKIIMGGSNTLIIYYITQKIRNKNVSCVLSYYTNDSTLGELPPLLSEVISLIK